MKRPWLRKNRSIPPGFKRPSGNIIFGADTVHENKCSWNHDSEVQKGLAQTLMENLMSKRAGLIKSACERSMGGVEVHPGMAKDFLEFVKFEGDDARLTWVFLQKKAVAVFTDPLSRIDKKAYCLSFRFLFL